MQLEEEFETLLGIENNGSGPEIDGDAMAQALANMSRCATIQALLTLSRLARRALSQQRAGFRGLRTFDARQADDRAGVGLAEAGGARLNTASECSA
jgi:hypothetical protein